jgi:hypothetical protein
MAIASGDDYPWTKPSMAFVHLIDRRQRRGLPGSMAIASGDDYPWTKPSMAFVHLSLRRL